MISLSLSLYITIESYELSNDFVYYPVIVTPVGLGERKSWIVKKRFSSFDKLHKQLSKTFTDIPACPKKTFFRMKAPKELDQRKKDLERFSNRLLAKKELYNNTYLIEFFEIDKNVPELTTKEYRSVIPKETFPVTSFLYASDDNLLIMAEKVNEEEEDTKSLLKCFEFKDRLKVEKSAEYVLKWSSKIQEEAVCIAYDSKMKTFVCGTDIGLIYILNVSNPDALNSSAPCHSLSVTSISFETIENYIITVGEDKKIVGTSLDGNILYSAKLGDQPLNCVILNNSNAITANSSGEIFFCDVKNIKAVLIYTMSIKEPILSLTISSDNILVCFMAKEVSWYDTKQLNEPLGNWKAKEQIASWGMYKHIIVIGNSVGELLFINLLTGKLNLTLPCHNEPIDYMHIDPSNGMIMTVSKNSALFLRKWPLH